jgi:hypothetical protein
MRDFDAAFAEAAGTPITFRLFGREWSVSRSVRAEAVLMAERRRLAGEDETRPLSRTEIIDFAKVFVGAELVDEWLTLGITIDQLSEVVAFVIQQQNGGDGVGEAEPAATPAKAEAGERSSNGGRSSKRTSNGSTASTSRAKSRGR